MCRDTGMALKWYSEVNKVIGSLVRKKSRLYKICHRARVMCIYEYIGPTLALIAPKFFE